MMLPAPIDGQALIGQDAAEAELAAAIGSDRLHHGWIFSGPNGIGKATLAYRAARFLLSDSVAPEGGRLDIEADSAAAHKISARAHPGLLVIEPPPPEPGKKAGLIPVEAVRRIGHFLSTTSGEGDWRIVIIDSADGLNRSGQNAILKWLEEPPERAIFFIIAHQIGRLLPTIRSRCRVLELADLAPGDVDRILNESGVDADPDLRALAIRFAEGDVERAAMIAQGDFGDQLRQLGALLDGLPTVNPGDAMAYSDKAGARGAELLFDITIDALLHRLADKMRQCATVSVGDAAPYAAAWEAIRERAAQTRVYNLDRAHCILASFFDIADAFNGLPPQQA